MLSLSKKDKQDLVLLFIGIVLINVRRVLEKPCKILHLNRKQMALNWACRWGNSGFLISLSQQNKKKHNALFVPFSPVCTGFEFFLMYFNFFTHTYTCNKTTVWPRTHSWWVSFLITYLFRDANHSCGITHRMVLGQTTEIHAKLTICKAWWAWEKPQ